MTEPLSTLAEAPPLAPLSGNYLLRHWRGQLSLPVSYWANGFLGNIVLVVVCGLAIAGISVAHDFVLGLTGLLVIWTTLILVATWQVVGTWRSAGRTGREKRAWLWPVVARVVLVLAVLNLGRTLVVTAWPQIFDFWQAARGDPQYGPRSVRILRGGAEIEISGPIARGVPEQFEAALARSPNAHIVHLDSVGGRISVATELGDIVRAHGLDTLVTSRCASACTIIFLAGHERWITDTAKLGFHSGRFASSDSQAVNRRFRDAFAAANIPASFVEKALSTPSTSIWLPTQEELLSNGIATKVAMLGQFAQSGYGPAPTREQAIALLLADPIYQALAKADPEHWPAIEGLWTRMVLDGLPITDVTSAVQTSIAATSQRLRTEAPDEVALALAQLIADETDAVQAADPEACWIYMTKGQIDLARYLPPALQQRDVAMTFQLLTEASAAPMPPTSAEEGKRLFAAAIERAKADGYDAQAMQAAFKPSARHEAFCPAYALLMRTALAMPPADGAALIRFLSRVK